MRKNESGEASEGERERKRTSLLGLKTHNGSRTKLV
jgi:hypothetical protein